MVRWGRVILLLALAAGIVWAWSAARSGRRGPTREMRLSSQDLEAGLGRRVPELHLHHSTVPQVVHMLESSSGATIELKLSDASLQKQVQIDLVSGTLEDALDRLVEQLADFAGYDVVRGRIIIAPEAQLPHVLRMYDVDELLAYRPSRSLVAAQVQLMRRVAWYIDVSDSYDVPPPFSATSGNAESMQFQLNKLLVVQTRQKHRHIARLLAALQAATPEGIGSETLGYPIPGPTGDFKDRAVVRIYDVRDLIEPLEAEEKAAASQLALPVRQGVPTRQMLLASLHTAWHGTINSATELAGTREIIAGRMILETTPPMHEKVVQLLRELRTELRRKQETSQ